MANQFISNFTQLWNNAGTTFNAIKVNVTNSASAAASKLMDLQIGGVSFFSVSKAGAVIAAGGIATTAITLVQSATPAPTAEGVVEWDTNEDVLRVGTGSATKQIGIAMGTSVATTSGTSIDFTGIPAGVKRIIVNLSGVSISGTAALYLQIGDSGGIENTGYLGSVSVVFNAANPITGLFTAGFQSGSAGAANLYHGSFILALLDPATNTWTCQGQLGASNAGGNFLTAGSKPLSATLDRIRLTTSNGTDTFDAGIMNIQYE